MCEWMAVYSGTSARISLSSASCSYRLMETWQRSQAVLRCSKPAFYSSRQRQSIASSACSCAGVGRNFSLKVLRTVSVAMLLARLRVDVPLNGFLAHIARRRGEVATRPHGRQLAEVRQLLAKREGRDTLTLLDHLGGAVARPDAHNQMDVVRWDGQRLDIPPMLGALRLDQLTASRRHRPHQHRLAALAALGAPDQVVHNQVDAMLVSLLVHDNNRARSDVTIQAE